MEGSLELLHLLQPLPTRQVVTAIIAQIRRVDLIQEYGLHIHIKRKVLKRLPPKDITFINLSIIFVYILNR